MMKHIKIYNQFDIVKLPFPFTDKTAFKRRPALVVSKPSYQINNNHCMLVMITSALQSAWLDDIEITNLELAGVSSPSIIRLKLFSLDESLIISQLGTLSDIDIEKISLLLKKYLLA